MRYLSILFFFLLSINVFAQSENEKFWEKWQFKPVIGFQPWLVYSAGQEEFDSETGTYHPVNDRYNALIRRTRFGAQVQVSSDLSFRLVGAADLIGRDARSGIVGGSNNGSFPTLGVWDAYVQWRLLPGREELYLLGGYLRPPFSRENLTGALRTSSIEKSMSQYYVRQHLVGTGPGRSAGLIIGGQIGLGPEKLLLHYQAALMNGVMGSASGNSIGERAAPLAVGRLVMMIGEPESKGFKASYSTNYYGKRSGLSLGASIARQGQTDLFLDNTALGIDLLWNQGPLHLEGEWSWMQRSRSAELQEKDDYHSQTGFLRAGYNIPIHDGSQFLEPTVMWMSYRGGLSFAEQALATELKTFAGEEETFDVGLNYHLQPGRLAVLLHYTFRQGDPGAAGEGAMVNQYFNQSGIGAIHRGDWLGLGLVFVY